jgi:hypothetical protein
MRLFQIAVAVSASLFICGCAKRPEDITAAYISPLAYEQYDCRQLGTEAQRVSARASAIMGVQQQKADNDAVAMGVGLILFWPALFFVKGGAETENEVAQLKGQMDTIEQVAIQKECGFEFERPAPPPRPRPPERSTFSSGQ